MFQNGVKYRILITCIFTSSNDSFDNTNYTNILYLTPFWNIFTEFDRRVLRKGYFKYAKFLIMAIRWFKTSYGSRMVQAFRNMRFKGAHLPSSKNNVSNANYTHILYFTPFLDIFLNLIGEWYERAILSTKRFCLWPFGGLRLGVVQEFGNRWFKVTHLTSSNDHFGNANYTHILYLTPFSNIFPESDTRLLRKGYFKFAKFLLMALQWFKTRYGSRMI